MLFSNVSVTSTRQQLGFNVAANQTIGFGSSAKPGTRRVIVTNNNVGSGTVYVQLVPTGTASTLTTSTYTFSAGSASSQPNPYIYDFTPGIDPPNGFDIWVISNTTANVNVQTVPF